MKELIGKYYWLVLFKELLKAGEIKTAALIEVAVMQIWDVIT
jgi:hypothetical protein